jgi:N6-L-threonylcarbamoyladenine synthase
MIILGVETSCDETAIAVLGVKPRQAPDVDITVLSTVISSQVKLHSKYGGVVPHLAAREHEKNLPSVFMLALKKSGTMINDIDLIAVTRGPGLSPALWRGVNFANELSEKFSKPIAGVNHLEGHIYSNWLNSITANSKSQKINFKEFSISKIRNSKIFPALNLIASGGHTELVLMADHGKYKLIGETLDDAVGEAFDKTARLLNLGYPGGAIVAKRASQRKFEFRISNFEFALPRPMIHSKNYNFSYSGLKTAVLYKIKELEEKKIKLTDKIINEICFEFQNAAIEVLIHKAEKAAKEYKVKSIMLSGGVSANNKLRSDLNQAAKRLGVKYFQPDMKYTTDNAAMIALAGYFNYKRGSKQTPIEVDPNLSLG